MRIIARLSVTLRLIRTSLFPADGIGIQVTRTSPSSSRALLPASLFVCCANPRQFADSTGEFDLFVPGAFMPAAPFVLFRLKRWGFSGCRVEVEGGGLRLVARR